MEETVLISKIRIFRFSYVYLCTINSKNLWNGISSFCTFVGISGKFGKLIQTGFLMEKRKQFQLKLIWMNFRFLYIYYVINLGKFETMECLMKETVLIPKNKNFRSFRVHCKPWKLQDRKKVIFPTCVDRFINAELSRGNGLNAKVRSPIQPRITFLLFYNPTVEARRFNRTFARTSREFIVREFRDVRSIRVSCNLHICPTLEGAGYLTNDFPRLRARFAVAAVPATVSSLPLSLFPLHIPR